MVDAVVTFIALMVSVLSLFATRRRHLWVVVPFLAGLLVAVGVVPGSVASRGIRPLASPLAFVLLAVPMAVLLDRYGLFEVLSAHAARGRYLGRLWVLAAAVTALLNLDAAVVLLTPLYVDIARRRGVSSFALALQPAVLSGLASLPLPYSNLTNLIVEAHTHASAADFLVHLGPATLAATALGWVCYRARLSSIIASGPCEDPDAAPRRAGPIEHEARVLVVGGILVAVIVTGFVLAPVLGGAPWQVAGGADLVLVAIVRGVPVRDVPLRSAAIVCGLGVLVAGAATHLDLAAAISGSRPADLVRTVAFETGLSDAVNNLPAILVSAPHLSRLAGPPTYAVLVGTNVGSLLVPTGSLALLLWVSLMNRLGVAVTPRHLLRVLWPIGLSGLVAAGALVVATATVR